MIPCCDICGTPVDAEVDLSEFEGDTIVCEDCFDETAQDYLNQDDGEQLDKKGLN